MTDAYINEELLKKYKWAGKIRLLCFLLLLLFLLLMKSVGGYSYLNNYFFALIFIEAVLNQPYGFIVRRVRLQNLQYFQMLIDIVAISWIMQYMGGLEAPLVSIAYYAVILWAGVVSTSRAVFFAAAASAIGMSFVVITEHIGMFSAISLYEHRMPTSQMASLLVGNISFLFAFGYFSAQSSGVIKAQERQRQVESVRNLHKFTATGYLVDNTVHDVLNSLACIKEYNRMLTEEGFSDDERKEMTSKIDEMEEKSSDRLTLLARFSKSSVKEHQKTDIHQIINDAIKLTWPILRYSKIKIEKAFGQDVPEIMANKDQLQEVFVALIFKILDLVDKEMTLVISTKHIQEKDEVEVCLTDESGFLRPGELKAKEEAVFALTSSDKTLGMGLTIAYEIVERHKGKIEVKRTSGQGTVCSIRLPIGSK